MGGISLVLIFVAIFVGVANGSDSSVPDSAASAYNIVTPPPRPHPAEKLISDLIGNCSCPAMKTTCEPIIVYRKNFKIVEVPGETRPVYLTRQKLEEIPIRETILLDKDVLQVQQQPVFTEYQPLDIIKEVIREEIEYYDVIVDRIQIEYNDIEERVILELEEPDIREEWIEEPVPVELKEEVLNVVEQYERIQLIHEIPNQINDTIPVQLNLYDYRPVARERSERIDCDNYRIVKVPRDDCQRPMTKPSGYLPPED